MIRTWLSDIRPLYEEQRYRRYYDTLPAFRKEKADRLRFQKDRAQSAGAWILLEKIRKKYRITEKAAFNLSHSGDYVLCSVDMECNEQTQVGCDIETVKEADLKVAKKVFLPIGVRGNFEGGQSKTAEGYVLQVLGAEGKFYEGHQGGNGAGYVEFRDPAFLAACTA